MIFIILFQIFVSSIIAEDPRCPFQSCSNSYNTLGCTINCESKEFPIMGPNIEKRIRTLRLNNLENIPRNAFQFLEITSLEIKSQNLKFIDDEAFANINKLDRLHLSNIHDISLILNKNKLQFLSKITNTLSIFNSSLDENNVLALLDQIKTWTKLEKLELNGNLFKKFNYDFNSFQNLKTLSLSDNLIETFDIKSQMLTELNINKNKITKVFNDSFLSSPNLINIYLNKNFINYIEPNSFCELKSLDRLVLSNNNLGSIKLYCLRNVSYLFLSNVGYEGEIDHKRMGDSINLIELGLSDNKINKINFEKMRRLKQLDLSSNNLSHLTEATVQTFPNLDTLDIRNNKFTQEILSNLKPLKFLNYLDISNNFLTEIKPSDLAENINLIMLNMDDNQINNVEFPSLENLSNLNLRNNMLRIIKERSFSNLKFIQDLNLDSNLISQIHSKAFFKNEVLTELS
ncbi:unnamed protein product, partial [Brachionus calyciflorus]